MKVYAVGLFETTTSDPRLLSEFKILSDFGFFQRGSVGEFMSFFMHELATRTSAGQRQSVKEQSYVCHVHAREDKVTSVVITDEEYPQRVAFTLGYKATDDFKAKFPAEKWTGAPQATPFPELEALMVRYQDPAQADNLMKVQRELDETQVVLRQAFESLLARDEKLDDLVSKSEELSATSKTFYKTAKSTNSCCVVT
eukprot:m.355593 g.355593  ORF g.355593 m.355593 type:complete len:198 (+) comp17288_c0_seq1:381-974(+)